MKVTIRNTTNTSLKVLNVPEFILGFGEVLQIDTLTATPEQRLLCGAIVQPENSTLLVALIPEEKISFEIDDIAKNQNEAVEFFTNAYCEYHKAKGISYLAKDSSGNVNLFFDLYSSKLCVRDPISQKIHTFTPDN